jgi:hypothetical protein
MSKKKRVWSRALKVSAAKRMLSGNSGDTSHNSAAATFRAMQHAGAVVKFCQISIVSSKFKTKKARRSLAFDD